LLWYARNDKILLECGLKVLDCVDVITFREENDLPEFLLLHRRVDEDPGHDTKWEYPKGGLEYNESSQEGAIRELLEETGADTIGMFRYGGTLAQGTPDVSDRKRLYDTLRVRCLTYRLIGNHELVLPKQSEEHDGLQWVSWRQAKALTWMPYGKDFLDLWKQLDREIRVRAAPPVSLALQATENCPHSCLYCHRRRTSEQSLSERELRALIDCLAQRGILRLTFTGGEPLLLGKDRLFRAMEHANSRGIHTCLSSTGIAGKGPGRRLTEDDLQRLDSFLDHLLISLNCIDATCAESTYQDIEDWRALLEMAFFLLKPREHCGFKVEVCTTVTRNNLESLSEIGTAVFDVNPHAYWRIDEYYPNGTDQHPENMPDTERCREFELEPGHFDEVKHVIAKRFPAQVEEGRIRFNSRSSRQVAPDVMLTPSGNMVTTSASEYLPAGTMHDLRTWQFENRRPYEEYRSYCRAWSWDTRSDWAGFAGVDDFQVWWRQIESTVAPDV
jgi:MoaA/NifB/PqqE/SkfB family radical SAM enzyme/8-oxo-dGTP pyrophosphatase MutT (NUDIX family)